MRVFKWLKRLRKNSVPQQNLKGRAEETYVRVELAEFAPAIVPFLNVNALAQLSLYEAATKAVIGAPSLAAKGAMAEIAAEALKKHQKFAAEIRRRNIEPHESMAPYLPVLKRYLKRVEVGDWHQHVLSVWLVGGIFDGFFAQLAVGLKDNYKREAISILGEETGRSALQKLLSKEISANPELADRLALWGRRLVGDTLLVAREVLALSENREFDAEVMDPIFTELTGEHMQRMDSLGLTA